MKPVAEVVAVVDPQGTLAERQIVSSSLALVAVSLLPTVIGTSGIAYFATAGALGLGLLGLGLAHANTASTASARRVLMGSLLYLPLLLAILAFDRP
jgi:heme o synthase